MLHLKSGGQRSFYLVILVLLAPACDILCLEQDAQIIRPLTTLARSIINAITLGEVNTGEIEFGGATDMARSFASLAWRTGFPLTIPAGVVNKTLEFVNRVRTRTETADVKNVKRKTLADLKVDLDAIVDAVEDQVRQSPDGLYTDYESVMVNGVPLEDALVAIGIQLKAYGVDVGYYRSLAGAVLGIPFLPTMASSVVEAANRVPNLATVANLTATVYQTGNQLLPAATGESIARLRALLQPLQSDKTITSPLSLIRSLSSSVRGSTATGPVGDAAAY